MKSLDYNTISNLFNKRLFENAKSSLLIKIAKNPNRYIGLYRPSKPYTKIIQNITQSHEIKFGDAFEELIRLNFESLGYKSLERNYYLENGDRINYDQLFSKDGVVIFIEQKVRDDHDSTKKRGQIENFEKKLKNLQQLGYTDIRSYIYFIDDSLRKNKNYYLERIEYLKEFYNCDIYLTYGKELYLSEDIEQNWEDDILFFLKKWKKSLPELPELNFDLDFEDTFNEIKLMSINDLIKLFSNEEIIKQIFPILFPSKKTLRILSSFYNNEFIVSGNNKIKKLYLLIDKSIELY